MADISLVLRVRNIGEIIAKKMTRTTRTQLEGRRLLFGELKLAELNDPKRALSKVNLTSMEVSMF